jgi:hypothetical protein
LTAMMPAATANNNAVSVQGTAETGSTLRLYTQSTCACF